MTNISAILSNAFTGLSTSQAALRATSNNVANVNTPGYSRQVVQIESLVAGTTGAGVRVSEVQRVADRFLELSVLSANSDGERYGVLRQFHDRLQGLIGRPDSEGALNARLDSAFNALSDLALQPSDFIRRQNAVSEISRFTNEIDRLATSIQSLRAEASVQMRETVNVINAALEEIHRLNPLIVQAQITNGETGPLLDQRDRALRELSEHLDINPIELPNGAVQVATASGLTLVDTVLRQFEYASPGVVTASTSFPQILLRNVDPVTGEISPESRVADGSFLSGRLKGLIDLRDAELPDLSENLGELARVFTDELNAVHNRNTSVPAPSALLGRNTGLVGSDPLNFKGQTDFAIVDGQGQLVRKVSVDFSALPPGATIDDLITTVNAGLGGDGSLAIQNGQLSFSANGGNSVVIADDEGNPSNRGGRGFSHFFGMNDLIRGQSPSHFETGFATTDDHQFTAGQSFTLELRDSNNRIVGSDTITIAGSSFDDILTALNDPTGLGQYATFAFDANGQLEVTANSGFPETDIHVLSDSTERGDSGLSFSRIFGLQEGSLANAARQLAVLETISNNPDFLGTAKFDLNAGVGDIAISIGDARGASALADLRLAAVNFEGAGSLSAVNASLSQYAGFNLSEAALKAERATRAEEDARALQFDVTKRREDFSGVNIDEELSNMITYQNSYNAAARLITTARELYDALIEAV